MKKKNDQIRFAPFLRLCRRRGADSADILLRCAAARAARVDAAVARVDAARVESARVLRTVVECRGARRRSH